MNTVVLNHGANTRRSQRREGPCLPSTGFSSNPALRDSRRTHYTRIKGIDWLSFVFSQASKCYTAQSLQRPSLPHVPQFAPALFCVISFLFLDIYTYIYIYIFFLVSLNFVRPCRRKDIASHSRMAWTTSKRLPQVQQE